MTDSKSSLPWWPFIAADGLFLAFAVLLLQQGHKPLLWWEAAALIVCVAGGAACALLPLLRRNDDAQSLARAQVMADALKQFQRIDEVAVQICGATTQWREFQQQSAAVSAATKSLAEQMAAEAKSFSEFLQKTNDSEKTHLRVEAEKLRRAEGEWLQVVIHILDHVTALYRAARLSGQPGLMEQIGQFHNICRETARRIGLSPMAAREGDAFDAKLHQLRDNTPPASDALVGETIAPGYTFQGQLVRRALVALKTEGNGDDNGSSETTTKTSSI